MKTIDLTVKLPQDNNKNIRIVESPLYRILKERETLCDYVVEALKAYTSLSLDDANQVNDLIITLKHSPSTTVSDEQFRIIENALASSAVEVKCTWNNMVNNLNK